MANFGPANFGRRGSGKANLGQSQFWPIQILANPNFANPFLDLVCVMVEPRRGGAPMGPEGWCTSRWGTEGWGGARNSPFKFEFSEEIFGIHLDFVFSLLLFVLSFWFSAGLKTRKMKSKNADQKFAFQTFENFRIHIFEINSICFQKFIDFLDFLMFLILLFSFFFEFFFEIRVQVAHIMDCDGRMETLLSCPWAQRGCDNQAG